MANKFKDFKEIIHGSKSFTFDGSVLEITGYYSGKRIRIDLDAIDEETFEEIVDDYDDEDDDDDDYEW